VGKIRQLSASVVNKIAAGEVIERPASVVKELLENALDAGATRIDVAIARGGSDSIRVTDNGSGIEAEDLPLAVASHATSKLSTAEDLFRVATLGFRGEALASIGEVSRLTIHSRTPDAAAGASLIVVGGQPAEVEPCGCPVGTTVEVADLFFNTPVRRKFLRATQTEMGHIAEAVARIALAHPGVHFTLRHNDREVYNLPPAEPWTERIERLFGGELAGQLIAVESRDEAVRLWGYVAHPSQSRGNQKMQYLFLNGRYIRDRSLQHALGEAYRGLLLTGRYPISFLRFEMPAELVDVNVHPTKLEVRFLDGGRLYSQLLSTLRTKFLTTDLTTQLQPRTAPPMDPADLLARQQQATQARRDLVDWAKEQLAGWPAPQTSAASAKQAQSTPHVAADHNPLEVTELSRSWAPVGEEADEEQPPGLTDAADGVQALPGPAFEPQMSSDAAPLLSSTESVPGPVAALQVHNRYLVAESAEGVVVIDQHALHERILYEQLAAKIEAGELESQSLLVPEPVDLSAGEAATVLEHRQMLSRLGIQVEPFGGDTVLVYSYPAMLANIRPAELLRGLAEQLGSGAKTPDRRDLLEKLLHSVACKAAVKAGDRLTPEEINALLSQRGRFRHTHHCPHGRPTELVFTREELDRQFKRT
jgi:DNA mismatch repair protein MutL